MLETLNPDQRRALIARLPCRIDLPDDVEAALSEEGYAPQHPNSERRAVRYRVCRRAALQIHVPLPAFPRSAEFASVVLRDVACNSAGFLHFEQLLPEEHVRLWLAGCMLEGRVTRCRKRSENCYEVGIELDERCRLRDILD